MITPKYDLEASIHDFIAKAEGSDTVPAIAQQLGVSEDEALTMTVRDQAKGYFARGQEPQGLITWRNLASSLCSDTYRALQEDNPSATREEINENPNLRKLNAVRRGIRAAACRSNVQLEESRRRL